MLVGEKVWVFDEKGYSIWTEGIVKSINDGEHIQAVHVKKCTNHTFWADEDVCLVGEMTVKAIEPTEQQRQEVIVFYKENGYPLNRLHFGLADRLQWENGDCETHWKDLIHSSMDQ